MSSIWEGFGPLWGVFWTLLAACWPFFGRSKSYLFETLVQHELQEAFGVDLESLLDDFGMVLGGFWEGLGRVWEALGKT